MKNILRKIIGIFLVSCCIAVMIQISFANEDITIYTRVSLISEITINDEIDYAKPNTTVFSLNAEVEILNTEKENQTIIDPYNAYPKVSINASINNSSLSLEIYSISLDTIEFYTYKPGITKENNLMILYINQTGLTEFPDGSYIFWRQIYIGTSIADMYEGKAISTNISIVAGVMNISYGSFEGKENPTEEIKYLWGTMTTMMMIGIYVRKQKMNNRKG